MSSLFISGQVVLCHSAVTRQDVCLICPAIVLLSATVQMTRCYFCPGVLQLSLQVPIGLGQRYSTIGTVYHMKVKQRNKPLSMMIVKTKTAQAAPHVSALLMSGLVWRLLLSADSKTMACWLERNWDKDMIAIKLAIMKPNILVSCKLQSTSFTQEDSIIRHDVYEVWKNKLYATICLKCSNKGQSAKRLQ